MPVQASNRGLHDDLFYGLHLYALMITSVKYGKQYLFLSFIDTICIYQQIYHYKYLLGIYFQKHGISKIFIETLIFPKKFVVSVYDHVFGRRSIFHLAIFFFIWFSRNFFLLIPAMPLHLLSIANQSHFIRLTIISFDKCLIAGCYQYGTHTVLQSPQADWLCWKAF